MNAAAMMASAMAAASTTQRLAAESSGEERLARAMAEARFAQYPRRTTLPLGSWVCVCADCGADLWPCDNLRPRRCKRCSSQSICAWTPADEAAAPNRYAGPGWLRVGVVYGHAGLGEELRRRRFAHGDRAGQAEHEHVNLDDASLRE